MMTYVVATVIALLISLGGYVWKLITDNKQLKTEAANEKAKNAMQEWYDRIQALEGKVDEDTRNYEDAKKKFEDDSDTPPASGAV